RNASSTPGIPLNHIDSAGEASASARGTETGNVKPALSQLRSLYRRTPRLPFAPELGVNPANVASGVFNQLYMNCHVPSVSASPSTIGPGAMHSPWLAGTISMWSMSTYIAVVVGIACSGSGTPAPVLDSGAKPSAHRQE